MSKDQKLLDRILTVPADLDWDELVTFLSHYGYREKAGKGSSHRNFINDDPTKQIISGLVRPHRPRKHVGRFYIRRIIDHLNLKPR